MKRCVWLSRHAPYPSQERSLSQYQITQCHPPSRYWSAADAWAIAQNACGGQMPDLVVMVGPLGMVQDFVRMVPKTVPVLMPILDFTCKPPRFVEWRRIVDVKMVTQAWQPSEAPG